MFAALLRCYGPADRSSMPGGDVVARASGRVASGRAGRDHSGPVIQGGTPHGPR
jgi:hypothetical protein